MDLPQLLTMFKALSNESRLRILDAIKNGQMKCACCPDNIVLFDGKGPTICCVEEIVEQFDMAQSTVSQHLKELHKAGLLERHKKAQWVYYTVNHKRLAELADYLSRFAADLAPEH